jgi:hypothetical protein
MHSVITFKDGRVEQVMGVPCFNVEENPQTVCFIDSDSSVITDDIELFQVRLIHVDLNEQG